MMQALATRQSAVGADSSRIAEMAVSIWKDIGMALSPIIGQPGVDALFKRSIHMARSSHACLATAFEDKARPVDLTALQMVLAQQTSTSAAAAHIAMLHNFQELLTSLIGPSLTERLLRPVWDKPSSGQAEQDTTS